MNEIIIVAHPGDNLNDLIKTGIEAVQIKTISYALVEFNDVKVFIKKDTTEESALEDYLKKLRLIHQVL